MSSNQMASAWNHISNKYWI